MDMVAIGIGGGALAVALFAWMKAGASKARIDELERELRRRTDGAAEELRNELRVQRELLATVAEGGRLSREQVLEGRLWSDASVQQALALVQGGARVLDVRTPGETAGGVIPGALLIPVDQLEARVRELPRDGKPLLVCCAGGSRSAAACEFLSQQGYSGLHNLEGGMNSWSGPRVRP